MAKLVSFAAIFFFATFSFGLVLVFVGVTPSEALTVWNVLPLLVASLVAKLSADHLCELYYIFVSDLPQQACHGRVKR